MTDREKAIVTAYTGITMLAGEKFQIFHKYVEDIIGRPIWTHELADPDVWHEIKEKSKDDFLELCKDESNDGWISVKNKLPNRNGVYSVTRIVEGTRLTDACYFDGQNTWHDDTRVNHGRPYITDIIAWQPLPESCESEDK